jgi:hypothetical protein
MGRNGLLPAPAGNDRAVIQGAYTRLTERSGRRDSRHLREIVPLPHDADTPTIEAFTFVLEQMRAAAIQCAGAFARARVF